jgi:transcriptional regulator with XRE-family HTH domain
MRVRLRRLEQGLSRRAISARIKFPVVKVAQLESGAVELTIGQLIRLAKMLKVPPAYFYAGLPTESRDRRRSN